MKKLLLLTGVSAISLAAFAADGTEPTKINDAFIQKISSNGKYAVSLLSESRLDIINLETGERDSYRYTEENDASYYNGIGKCISDNGILVGGTTFSSAEYWKDGDWHVLPLPDGAVYSNTANAITPDGSRICGMIGVGGIALDGDNLMVAPCIWNAEADGFSMPVMLPYPKQDYAGRMPQYVKAIDISGDGKTIVGMVTDAVGYINYPILYFEDNEGNWNYKIPHEDLLVPKGFEIPTYPGEYTGEYPMPTDYMTDEELEAYNEALTKYYNGELEEEPNCLDYMSGEDKEAFEKIMVEYNTWYEKFQAWSAAMTEIQEYCPSYQNNSVCISEDGLTYGCTISEGGGFPWGGQSTNNVWVFDINSDNITKYDQQDNLCLTYLANGGIVVSSTPVSYFEPSNSFILKDGEVIDMYAWMNTKMPEYASWMKQNMEFEYEGYDPETWDIVNIKEFMTGHATSNPDLSILSLSVPNIGFPEDPEAWEDPDYEPVIGFGFIFNLNADNAVKTVNPAVEENAIYDLSGRKLKEASAPGIYIINGEKKVLR